MDAGEVRDKKDRRKAEKQHAKHNKRKDAPDGGTLASRWQAAPLLRAADSSPPLLRAGKHKKHKKHKKHGGEKGDAAVSRQARDASAAKYAARKEGERSTAEIVLEINRLWEKLRSKKNSAEESAELSERVHALVGGRVCEMALKHDASRALQAVYHKGTAQHRSQIVAELSGKLRDLCMSKYGRQVIIKILRTSAKDRPLLAPIFAELRGFTRKLLTHKVAAAVVNCMYGEVGTAEQRGRMVLDCCGREVSLLVDEAATSTSLAEIFARQPNKKSAILGRLHDLLLTLAQKQSVHSQLALHLLREYVEHAEHSARMDVLGSIAPLCEQIVEMKGTKESESALFELLSYGSAKERKVVLKGLKGSWADLTLREYGHRIAMRALVG